MADKKVHFTRGKFCDFDNLQTYTSTMLYRGEMICYGLFFSVALLIVWGKNNDPNTYQHLIFCIIMVWVVLLSILCPIIPPRRKELYNLCVSISVIFQLTATFFGLYFCVKDSAIIAFSITLITAGQSLPLVFAITRLIFAVFAAAVTCKEVASRIAILLLCIDTLFWFAKIIVWAKQEKRPKKKPEFKPKQETHIKSHSKSPFRLDNLRENNLKANIKLNIAKPNDIEISSNTSESLKLIPTTKPVSSEMHPSETPHFPLRSSRVENKDIIVKSPSESDDPELKIPSSPFLKSHTQTVQGSSRNAEAPKTKEFKSLWTSLSRTGQNTLRNELKIKGGNQKEQFRLERYGSFLNDSDPNNDAIKMRLYSEYFSIIEDLVVISDSDFHIIMSNFNNEICRRVIKKMPRIFSSSFVQSPESITNLGECFYENYEGSMNVPEETVHNLISLAAVFDLKEECESQSKLAMLESKKILKCLKAISRLDHGVRKSKEDEMPSNSFGKGHEKKFRSSLRAINITKQIMATMEVSVLDILTLLKEYFDLPKSVTHDESQSRRTISLDLYLIKEQVQMKIRVLYVDGHPFLFTSFENIREKISLGEVNSKLKYSMLLINSFSHEMFTPLHHLIGMSERLLKRLSNDGSIRSIDRASAFKKFSSVEKAEVTDEVLVIKQIGLGLKIFVQNILDFASIVNNTFSQHRRKFFVREALDYMISMFSIKAKQKGIKIAYETDPTLDITTDFSKLCGCLYNFIDNSVKFTQKGGIEIHAKLTGSKIVFRVVDTGLGISEQDLQKISDIFKDPLIEEPPKNAAGIGIGLRMSQALLKKLTNGDLTIEIQSEKNKGTTIQFEIMQGFEHNPTGKPNVPVAPNSPVPRSIKSHITFNSNDVKGETAKRFISDRANLVKMPNYSDFGRLLLQESKVTTPTTPLGQRASLVIHSSTQEDPRVIERSPKANGLSDAGGEPSYEDRSAYEEPPGGKMDMFNENDKQVKRRLKRRSTTKLVSLSIKQVDSVAEQTSESKGVKEDDFIYEVDEIHRNSRSFQLTLALGKPVLKRKRPVALIIDDEVLNVEIAKEIVSDFGIHVLEAQSGEIGIEVALKMLTHCKRIDIIFLDYNMPGMCGDEVATILRQENFLPILKDTPIVGLTAHTDEATIQKCLKAGMTRVEHKPFDIEKIRSILEEYDMISLLDQNKATYPDDENDQESSHYLEMEEVQLELEINSRVGEPSQGNLRLFSNLSNL